MLANKRSALRRLDLVPSFAFVNGVLWCWLYTALLHRRFRHCESKETGTSLHRRRDRSKRCNAFLSAVVAIVVWLSSARNAHFFLLGYLMIFCQILH